jgi:ring-1,2-phenylacetyl-CoA epoxidase subunit PaaC
VSRSVPLSDGSREFVLAFADDEHMIGARHTSWIGLGPFLEEDLAFCSIAQDELGHAIALYDMLLDDAGRQNDELDAFALMRDAADYRSCHLAEIECSDWNDSLVRHWLYDRAESIRWQALLQSSHQGLAQLAARALREESFHIAHAEQFMSRIAPGRPQQILASIDRLLPIAIGQWTPVDGEVAALDDGVAPASSTELAERWELAIRTDLADWHLDVDWPASSPAVPRTVRSAGFDDFLTGLRKVVVLDETAVW